MQYASDPLSTRRTSGVCLAVEVAFHALIAVSTMRRRATRGVAMKEGGVASALETDYALYTRRHRGRRYGVGWRRTLVGSRGLMGIYQVVKDGSHPPELRTTPGIERQALLHEGDVLLIAPFANHLAPRVLGRRGQWQPLFPVHLPDDLQTPKHHRRVY